MVVKTVTDIGAENYFRQLVENMGLALIATDTNLNIQTWNAAAARMFGAGAERMIGSPLGSVLPHERRQEAEVLLQRAIDLGETHEFEFQDRDSAGNKRELTGAIAPVVSDTGKRVGASICIRDISRRIALQNELHQNRKMTALGGMAGAVAHYFNNTIGGVITSIDFANTSDDIDVKDRLLQQTSRSLLRITNLVNGLLVFAEGDQRVDDLGDFTEIVLEIADDIEEEAKERGVTLTLNMPTLPVMPVPRAQVLTVLRNITQNALDAMPDGGLLTIDVNVDAAQIVTHISDTGHGLDERAMSRIFEPFFTTKKRTGLGVEHAAGLGLAMAHGIVQMLGGAISVSSIPNNGSRFSVTLPRRES